MQFQCRWQHCFSCNLFYCLQIKFLPNISSCHSHHHRQMTCLLSVMYPVVCCVRVKTNIRKATYSRCSCTVHWWRSATLSTSSTSQSRCGTNVSPLSTSSLPTLVVFFPGQGHLVSHSMLNIDNDSDSWSHYGILILKIWSNLFTYVPHRWQNKPIQI